MDAFANCSNVFTLICLCSESKVGRAFLTAWFVLYMLLVPVFLSVLCVGCRRCRTQRSDVSHSDAFTFHMVTMELVAALGSVAFTYGQFRVDLIALDVGLCLCSVAYTGQMLFHCLTCVERYLAVVHPITYLRLKKRRGVTMRNFSIGCVWLFSASSFLFIVNSIHLKIIVDLMLTMSSLALVSFCSISVLCVLIRPGPGDGGGDRKRINRSKRSAFYTILAVLGVLLTRLVHIMVCQCLSIFKTLEACLAITSMFWFGLPSSLVLPLLFLHRAGKLSGKRQRAQSD